MQKILINAVLITEVLLTKCQVSTVCQWHFYCHATDHVLHVKSSNKELSNKTVIDNISLSNALKKAAQS